MISLNNYVNNEFEIVYFTQRRVCLLININNRDKKKESFFSQRETLQLNTSF